MRPSQILKHIPQIQDTIKRENIASYLLSIHYPWMNKDKSISSLFLYEQAYLSTLGKAEKKYQDIYDAYIEPLLMNLIGKYLYLTDKQDIIQIYQYIRSSPIRIRSVLEQGISSDIVLESVQLDRIAQDTE